MGDQVRNAKEHNGDRMIQIGAYSRMLVTINGVSDWAGCIRYTFTG